MSFRFFATPTVVFRSSRLGEDFSKFPESSYRSSKKKTENCANHDSYPSPRGGVKEWFGSLSIQLPSSKLQIPDSCLFFQVPAHLHTFIFCQHTTLIGCYYLMTENPVNWGRFVRSKWGQICQKKDWLISCGCVRCPQGSFSEYYIFFPPTRDALIVHVTPKNQYFQIVPYLCCFLGNIPIYLGCHLKFKFCSFFVLGSQEAAKCRNHVTQIWKRVGWTS